MVLITKLSMMPVVSDHGTVILDIMHDRMGRRMGPGDVHGKHRRNMKGYGHSNSRGGTANLRDAAPHEAVKGPHNVGDKVDGT